MAKQVDFAIGTIVGDTFLDDRQEVESATAWGITVRRAGTVLSVNPASDGTTTGQSSLILNGTPCTTTTNVTLDMTGNATGTYNIYASASSGTFVLSASTGAGPSHSRKIAEVDWTGTPTNTITAVRNLVDSVSGHGYRHRPGGADDPIPTAAAVTLTDVTANAEGTAFTLARSDHTHNLDLSGGIVVGGSSTLVNLSVTGTVALGDAGTDTVAFFGSAGSTRTGRAYTLSNVITDRTYDANNTSIDELADVLGSVIQDLQAYGLVG